MKISQQFFRKYIANFAIILALAFVGILTYSGGAIGAFSSTNKTDIIYSGNVSNNTISLMFNVYMGNEYVEQILNILKENNAKATFFVGGVWVNKNEECFMKIVESGNEIASHGYWHKDHSKISDDEQINEIKMTEELVENISGIKMALFAPPSGAFNKSTASIAKALGYKTIMWTRDTIDWRDQDANLITSRATNNAKSGDLILCHPTKATVQALPGIIAYFQQLNLNIGTVSQNLA